MLLKQMANEYKSDEEYIISKFQPFSQFFILLFTEYLLSASHFYGQFC